MQTSYSWIYLSFISVIFTGVEFHIGLMNRLLHYGASSLHPTVLIKYVGFVFRLWSCLVNVVAHDCPHNRQCVLVWGFHTDEKY